jgi:hypothetical protein
MTAVNHIFSSGAWIPLLIGIHFTVFGCLKLYGRSRGIVGGAGETFQNRLCGT